MPDGHVDKPGKSPTSGRPDARIVRTVEPFNSWFKTLFELEDRVWHRNLDNNRTQHMAALLIYQLLLRINHQRGRNNGQIKWILDSL